MLVGGIREKLESFLKTHKTILMQGWQKKKMPRVPDMGVNEESHLVGIGMAETLAP